MKTPLGLRVRESSLACVDKPLTETRVRWQRKLGFTLVELMVALLILALLSSVVTITVRGFLIRGKQQVARVQIGNLLQALDTFYAEFDRYPTNEEGLDALQAKSAEYPEGIIARVPKDPWQFPYEYRSPGATEPFEIICFGADHREGGEGGNLDITSAQVSRGKQ